MTLGRGWYFGVLFLLLCTPILAQGADQSDDDNPCAQIFLLKTSLPPKISVLNAVLKAATDRGTPLEEIIEETLESELEDPQEWSEAQRDLMYGDHSAVIGEAFPKPVFFIVSQTGHTTEHDIRNQVELVYELKLSATKWIRKTTLPLQINSGVARSGDEGTDNRYSVAVVESDPEEFQRFVQRLEKKHPGKYYVARFIPTLLE